jgi:hypothetical protein
MACPDLAGNVESAGNPDPKANPASVDLPDPVERVDLQAAALCW